MDKVRFQTDKDYGFIVDDLEVEPSTPPLSVPTITSASPNSGSTGGGTVVTLTGTNLTGATSVKFDGTAATGFIVNNATTITATTPAHAAGAVNVAVTTPGGPATLPGGYTYQPPLGVNTSFVNVACNGASTGSATALPAGGTPGYVYSWTNGASTQTIFNLSAGSYTVTVGDTKNERVSATVTITQPSAITANPSFINPTSGTNGSASVNPFGGAGGYTYLWSSSAASQTTATATGLGAGTHTVTITDANGCPKQQSFTLIASATAPSAPTIGTATAGDGQASVTFTAPGSDGGSAIISYTVISSPHGITGSGANSPITVAGLSNGTAYTFRVTATNNAGTGAASAASNPATPKGNQTITFPNPGAQNFGTTPNLSSTASATSSLAPTFTSSTPGVCTITSGGALTFVTAGSCTIDADQAGNATWNAATTVAQTFTVNAIAPGAPTIGTATAGDTQASVSFTAPASTGGAAITGYTVTANQGGATATGSSSPITVTGLTNGTAYTFTVTATNSAGTGNASAASNSVTPAAPQIITFGNPGTQNFGTTPTLTATSSAGSGYPVSFTSSTTGVCTITTTGTLTFVTAGTCSIHANQAGGSSYLAAPQVSQSFTVSPVVPGAPTAATATAGDTQASIAFTAPVFTGGATISGYTVTVNPADVAPVNKAGSPIVVAGLTNGQAYTFTVTATNSAGTGPASAASNSMTPAASQTITFAAPVAQNFGTTPTLTATSSSGLTPIFTSSTTGVCTITSGGALTFVTTGTCTINANQAGNGSYLAAAQVTHSFAVNAAVPGAPTIGTATAGNTQAAVHFTAPALTGGAAITGYTVTVSPGNATVTGTASPIAVTGLTNGMPYTFTVRASNSAGPGSPSAASNSVTPQAATTGTVPVGSSGTGTATAGAAATAPQVDPSCNLTSARFTGEVPPGYNYTYGTFEFLAAGCTQGVKITLTYPQPLATDVKFMKYGPKTAGATTSEWFEWSENGGVAVSGDRRTITYTVLDNGAGDTDPRVGYVNDPLSPVAAAAPAAPASIPTLGTWALALLSALLGALGWRQRRAT